MDPSLCISLIMSVDTRLFTESNKTPWAVYMCTESKKASSCLYVHWQQQATCAVSTHVNSLVSTAWLERYVSLELYIWKCKLPKASWFTYFRRRFHTDYLLVGSFYLVSGQFFSFLAQWWWWCTWTPDFFLFAQGQFSMNCTWDVGTTYSFYANKELLKH